VGCGRRNNKRGDAETGEETRGGTNVPINLGVPEIHEKKVWKEPKGKEADQKKKIGRKGGFGKKERRRENNKLALYKKNLIYS